MKSRFKFNHRNLILIIFAVTISTGCNFVHKNIPPFDLSIFLNKLFETFLEIIVVLFGFILLNIFWTRQEEKRKSAPHREYLKTQTRFIETLTDRSIALLQEKFSPTESFRVNQRNEEIQSITKILHTISNATEKVLSSNYEKLDARTSQGYAFFQTYIIPNINLLFAFNQKEIQPYLSEIEQGISNLSKNTKNLKMYLEEIINELNASF